MAGQPLQTGIREHKVTRSCTFSEVVRRIERDKFQLRMFFTRIAQHVRRIVRADNPCMRKVLATACVLPMPQPISRTVFGSPSTARTRS